MNQKQSPWLSTLVCLLVLGLGGCKKKPDDAALTSQVQAKVSALDPGINVTTKEGVVTLSGAVAAESAVGQAEQAAKEVEGVKSVENQLAYTPPPTAAPTEMPAVAVEGDATLKSNVEANLTKYGVTGVTASVANGEVTLTGDIQRNKLQDAIKAANEAQPKKVNNQLTLK